MRNQQREVVMIGHKGHPEVEGTMGQSKGGMYLVETVDDIKDLNVEAPGQLSFVTQTTLSVDDATLVISALKESFPEIQGPKKDDICYATQNRQDAVKDLAGRCEVVLVVGSPNSSNSNRLRELAERMDCRAYLIDNATEMDRRWFDGIQSVGVTAGASAPEILIQEVLQQLQDWGGDLPSELSGIEENVTFSLPKALRIPVTQLGK